MLTLPHELPHMMRSCATRHEGIPLTEGHISGHAQAPNGNFKPSGLTAFHQALEFLLCFLYMGMLPQHGHVLTVTLLHQQYRTLSSQSRLHLCAAKVRTRHACLFPVAGLDVGKVLSETPQVGLVIHVY